MIKQIDVGYIDRKITQTNDFIKGIIFLKTNKENKDFFKEDDFMLTKFNGVDVFKASKSLTFENKSIKIDNLAIHRFFNHGVKDAIGFQIVDIIEYDFNVAIGTLMFLTSYYLESENNATSKQDVAKEIECNIREAIGELANMLRDKTTDEEILACSTFKQFNINESTRGSILLSPLHGLSLFIEYTDLKDDYFNESKSLNLGGTTWLN